MSEKPETCFLSSTFVGPEENDQSKEGKLCEMPQLSPRPLRSVSLDASCRLDCECTSPVTATTYKNSPRLLTVGRNGDTIAHW